MADVEHVGSYRVRVPRSGQRPSLTTDLDLATILSHTVHALGGDRWTGLRNGTLTLYADTEETALTPVRRWVTAEVDVEGGHMLPHEGQWYEIGDRHSEFLRREVTRILNRPPGVVLPPWRRTWRTRTATTASQPAAPGSGAAGQEAPPHGAAPTWHRPDPSRGHGLPVRCTVAPALVVAATGARRRPRTGGIGYATGRWTRRVTSLGPSPAAVRRRAAAPH
ncbi:DUF6119 family protein [Micromonospora tulbaghiae]|uniref:DUF6119 family protein n=1 Tax=Micromonospora TaxID=1873 RepID=UPI00332859D2